MKISLLSILLLAFGLSGFAQPPEDQIPENKREEIEAMKVAFLTRRMELTREESQTFWPVYNEYQDELDAHRKSGKKMNKRHRTVSDPTEAELDQIIEERLNHERSRIDIEEKYYGEFKKVLPPRKIALYYASEKAFKRELLKRLRNDRPIPEGNTR